MGIKKIIKRAFPSLLNIKSGKMMRKWNRDLYKQHKNNNISSKTNQNKAGYVILLDGHAIEKGMTSPDPRRFGDSKTSEIIKCLSYYKSNGWKKDFAYSFGISILNNYVYFYEQQGWIDDANYKTVKAFIKNEDNDLGTGILEISKRECLGGTKTDYNKFLSCRHSIRRFDKKKISDTDMKSAVEMAIKTPTACNRQMIKVYRVKNSKIKNEMIKYSKGMTNFDNDSANMLVVTYDTTAFRWHEMHQGLFNAGLFSMNLVNALHSLGIGSCMLEYFAEMKNENTEKKLLGIPDNEKIAVVIAAGYYPEKATVPRSVRKPISEIYREV